MTELLKYIGIYSAASALIAGMIGYLAKKIIEQILNKDLEKFKGQLQSENQKAKLKFDKEMESYKAGLNLISSRQSKLYSKRSEVIEKLYQKLVDFNNAMLDMTALMRNVTGKDEKTIQAEEFERISETAELGNGFFLFYQKNKIYFKAETRELIEQIQEGLKQSHSDYSFRYLWGVPPSEMTYKMAKGANEKVRKEIPKLLNTLEDEFRKSIGVIEEEIK